MHFHETQADIAALPKHHKATQDERLVIAASSLGTVFEWYDFYLYGLLATFIAKVFFAGVNETTGFILALGAFAAGFIVRPFGALVFGRIGDMVGRKNTFLVTMGLMGLSTFGVGLLPGYATLGVASPIILVLLRVVQGLALGGEYGGAATYVAEHAPEGKRGLYTSFIQITATFGLFAALLVVIGIRKGMGEDIFSTWGWRMPFVVSIFLLGVSMWIRLQLNESPVYQKMKDEGTTSKAPLTEAFGQWKNLRVVLICLFGAAMGQAVVWYTGQFYAMFYLEKILKVEGLGQHPDRHCAGAGHAAVRLLWLARTGSGANTSCWAAARWPRSPISPPSIFWPAPPIRRWSPRPCNRRFW
jgi:MFS family permease